MDRLLISGLFLAVTGLIGLLAAELVGTAHASRPGDKTYLLALSSGSALRLVTPKAGLASVAVAAASERRLDCARVVDVTAVSLGFRCRGQ